MRYVVKAEGKEVEKKLQFWELARLILGFLEDVDNNAVVTLNTEGGKASLTIEKTLSTTKPKTS